MKNDSSIIPTDFNKVPAGITLENELDLCDLFPVVNIPEAHLQRYKKVPLAGLTALGAAFSQLPEAARTIVQTTTAQIEASGPLYVGINPKNIPGTLIFNELGTVGNIMQINEQGKRVIAGRMRFLPVDTLPANFTSEAVIPFNPALMAVAVAVMAIEQKLDKIQSSVEDVLKFLELEKQAKQRGNLRKLAEISEDYKVKCEDKAFCTNRNFIVQTIQVAALQDIEFYRERVAIALQKQKGIPLSKDTTALTDSVVHEFAEYQLACYLYAHASFLDVMLRRDFSKVTLDKTTEKLTKIAAQYDTLYTDCRSQLAQYQRKSLESKVVGGLGVASKGLGKAIGAIPVIREGPIDEALLNAGTSLGRRNRDTVVNKLSALSFFEENYTGFFVESLASVHLICNADNAMLTDGENLYILKEA